MGTTHISRSAHFNNYLLVPDNLGDVAETYRDSHSGVRGRGAPHT